MNQVAVNTISSSKARLGKGVSGRSVLSPATNTEWNPLISEYTGQYQFVSAVPVQDIDVVAFSQRTQFVIDVSSLTASAIESFKAIPEVHTIYRSIDEERVYFCVFTSNTVYDYELMKRLIQVEIDLSKEFPHIGQTYRYTASILVEDYQYITASDEPPIYSR